MSPNHTAAGIFIISTCTVKSSTPLSCTGRVELTPWDLELLLLEYSQKGLLFLKPTSKQGTSLLSKISNSTPSLINHLKHSLEQTFHFFPPLAGRLATTQSNDRDATCYFIDCNNEGAVFIHAATQDPNLTVADIQVDSSNYVPEVIRSFFPFTGVRNHEGVSRPLLAVQVTELADGLFIGCSINHLLVDGTSFWHFFSSWAEISRGSISQYDSISKLPCISRGGLTLDLVGSSCINIKDENLILEKNIDDIETKTGNMFPTHNGQSETLYSEFVSSVSSHPLKERVFYLTKECVTKLKAKANQEMVRISDGKISSLQAIIAHVWRSIIRCCFSTNSDGYNKEKTTFEIPMGARQRLDPPLPEEYFGNAVFPGVVTVEVKKMLENGLGWTAWQVNRMVASQNGPEQVNEIYKNWIKEPNFLKFDKLPRNHFVLINSPRFDVYGPNDFGWGKPVAVRSGGANSFDGRITISRGAKGEGDVEVEACLSPETLCALVEDAEFMAYVEYC